MYIYITHTYTYIPHISTTMKKTIFIGIGIDMSVHSFTEINVYKH